MRHTFVWLAILLPLLATGCTHAKPPAKPPEPLVWPSGLEFLAPMPELHGITSEMTESEFLQLIKGRDLRVLVARRPNEVSYHVYTRSGENAVVMFDDVEPRGIQRLMPEAPTLANIWRPGLYEIHEDQSSP